MASANSPRQRMINLMYLVFIAMLALNMSKEVLTAFGILNEKLEYSNEEITKNNQAFLKGLEVKASENPDKYAELYQKGVEITSRWKRASKRLCECFKLSIRHFI